MVVTNVSLYGINPLQQGVCARARVEFDDCLVVRNVKLIKGKRGLFMAFPNTGTFDIAQEGGKKKYTDIVYLKDAKQRADVERLLIDTYTNLVKSVDLVDGGIDGNEQAVLS